MVMFHDGMDGKNPGSRPPPHPCYLHHSSASIVVVLNGCNYNITTYRALERFQTHFEMNGHVIQQIMTIFIC